MVEIAHVVVRYVPCVIHLVSIERKKRLPFSKKHNMNAFNDDYEIHYLPGYYFTYVCTLKKIKKMKAESTLLIK